jgi:hypothetical protein
MRYRTWIVVFLIVSAATLTLAALVFFSAPVVQKSSRPAPPVPAIGTVIAVEAPEYVVAYSIPDEDFCDACEMAPGGTLTATAAGPEKVLAVYQAPVRQNFSLRPCRDGAIVIVEARRFLGTGSPADAGPDQAGRLGALFGRLLTGRRCPTIIRPFFGQPK